MKPIARILSIILGLLLLTVVLLKADLREVAKVLSEANVSILVYSVVAILVLHICKAIRWRITLKPQLIDITIVDSYLIYLSGLLAGIVTPGRVGDIVRVFHLREMGYSYKPAILSVILDRILDVILLAGIGMVGLYNYIPRQSLIHGMFILLVIVLLPVLLYFVFRGLFQKFQLIVNIESKLLSIVDDLREIVLLWAKMSVGSWVIVGFLSLVGWASYYLGIFIIAKSLNIPVTYWQTTVLTVGSALVALLPISIAGIGTRDIFLVSIFSAMNLNPSHAVVFSICILISILISAAFGSIGYFSKPLPVALSEIDQIN